MKKTSIFILITTLCLSPFSFANETKISDDEFLKKFMEQEKRKEEAKAKTKALEKLEKKVDELAKTLGVDK